MSQINISHLTFAYDGSYENIFNDVSLSLDTDWKLGLCGRNGRGKTTLLKLIMGEYEYSGAITASVRFEYFPYHVPNPAINTLDVLTVPVAVGGGGAAFGGDGAPVDTLDIPLWKIQKELSLLHIPENVLFRPFSTLSNGEQTKVLLAGLFLRENGFLLIDEPTNHLDMAARQTVAKYLSGKSCFILVSHDRAFLDECVDHVLSINKTNIEIQSGNFSSWLKNKQMQDDFELAENKRLKKDISRLETAARQTADWSDKVEKSKNQPLKSGLKADKGYIGHRAAKMMKRSKSAERRRQDAVQEKSALLRNIETAAPLKLRPLKHHSSRLLSVENLSIAYGENTVFRDMSFTLEQGERVALIGGNGCGKSSLLKLICGETPAGAVAVSDGGSVGSGGAIAGGGAVGSGDGTIIAGGTVTLSSGIVISYVPQDASFLAGDLDEYAAQNNIDLTLFKTILRKLDFSRVQFEKDMQDYSAGQKKKVLLAKSLCMQAHLYIWDEPLNYIDVLSRIQIEELILAHKPTLLFVEHDRAFCDNIATKELVF